MDTDVNEEGHGTVATHPGSLPLGATGSAAGGATGSAARDANGSAAGPGELLAQSPSPVRARQLRELTRAGSVGRRLLVADLLSVSLSVVIGGLAFPAMSGGIGRLILLVAYVPLTMCFTGAHGLYTRDREWADYSTADDVIGILQSVTLASWVILALGIVSGTHRNPSAAVLSWLLTIMLMVVLRAAARTGQRRGSQLQNTVIVGAGEIGQLVADKLLRNPQFGCRLVGFVDAHPRGRPQTLRSVPMLGGLDALDAVIRDLGIKRVMIAFSEDSLLSVLHVLRSLRGHTVHVDIVPRLFEVVGPRATVHALEGLPLVGVPRRPPTPLRAGVKRAMDVTAAAVALVASLPVLVAVALRIKLDSPGPALYWSERIGLDGRRFALCKFRTMRMEHCRGERYGSAAAEAQFAQMMSDPELQGEFERSRKLRHDPRVTGLGARLRRSHLDELPQLWNVLRGDLSLVGPRPITAEEFVQFELERPVADPESAQALGGPDLPGYWELKGMRPGLTGYWQITGGSHVPYEERLRLDLLYAADWSMRLDLLILAKTFGVLARRGAY
ncbi:MAG TPA: sugar transferase [Solirubrobacteraceae bacterium]|nr:sugar transferase [Solirubrobacteraceae bacterium]